MNVFWSDIFEKVSVSQPTVSPFFLATVAELKGLKRGQAPMPTDSDGLFYRPPGLPKSQNFKNSRPNHLEINCVSPARWHPEAFVLFIRKHKHT